MFKSLVEPIILLLYCISVSGTATVSYAGALTACADLGMEIVTLASVQEFQTLSELIDVRFEKIHILVEVCGLLYFLKFACILSPGT